MAFSSKALVLTTAAAAVLAAAPASAQFYERNRNVSVRERPQPGYDPLGVPVGAFRAYLTLPVGVVYNDNVFALPDGEEDIIITVRPRAELRSQWSNHELVLAGEVENETYQDFDSENRTNVHLGASGRLDIQRGFFATGFVNQHWLSEARTDASAPLNTVEPVQYDLSQLGASLSKEFTRVRFSGGVSRDEFDYDDAIDIGTGLPVPQDDRDHEAIALNGRIDYAVTPTTAIFGSVTSLERSYDVLAGSPPNQFSRDSEGLTFLVGADFDITNLIRGVVSVGSLSEDFSDPGFEDVDGFAASARVEWFPTSLATVELAAERSVTATGVPGAAAALTTTYSARVDYEVQRNIILTGQVSRRDDEFEGIPRDDEGLAAAIDLLYLVNEHVGASFSLGHAERTSSGAEAGPEFDQKTVGVNLVLRY